jgi:hypothetical protein
MKKMDYETAYKHAEMVANSVASYMAPDLESESIKTLIEIIKQYPNDKKFKSALQMACSPNGFFYEEELVTVDLGLQKLEDEIAKRQEQAKQPRSKLQVRADGLKQAITGKKQME